jgi:hypothetical protein
MSEPHYFSLRTTSDIVAILVMMAVGGFGFFVVNPPLVFLFSAVVTGMLFGVADLCHFLDAKWPRGLAVFMLVMLAAEARDLFSPGLGSGARFLASLQFLAFAMIAAMMVVQVKQLVARKENHG